MDQGTIRIAAEPLKKFATDILTAVGMPPEDAENEAGVLVWSNLRGVDSHGVMRITHYVKSIDTGLMNPKPKIKIINETPATIFVEADHAFGAVVTTFAMERVIEKAKKLGIGWGLIRNNTHQGAMGYYAWMAAQQDLIGIAAVASGPIVAPFGAKAAGVSNNPIAFSLPTANYKPIVFDMATSVVAMGKIRLARENGKLIPEGWAIDEDGNPTTDPEKVKALLPAGGAKGSGLSFIFECMASILATAPIIEPVLHGRRSKENLQNSFIMAVDIATFGNVNEYKKNIDEFIGCFDELPPAKGFTKVMAPGMPEWATWEERSKNGIPIAAGTAQNLREVARRFGVSLPIEMR
jgi:ureidoglycolate dehydrogenase (NAD+)